MEKDSYIGFRVPFTLHQKFESHYPDRGKRSKILRALLQMFLENKIPKVEYKEVDVIK